MITDPVLIGIVFSDSVIREHGTGKLSFIGTFHQLNSNNFPFALPKFIATALLTNMRGKLEKPINITVRIEDPSNGHVLKSMSGNVAAKQDYEFSGYEVLEMPFPITQVPFMTPGIYSVVALVDNEKIGTRNFPVNAMTGSPLQPPKNP